LDLATSPLLRHALRDAQLYAHVVVLDLREVTFIESTAVHVILDAAASVRRGDGRLILVRGPTHVDLNPSDPPARALLHIAQHKLVT
jgi:anti-anti-sigma factor